MSSGIEKILNFRLAIRKNFPFTLILLKINYLSFVAEFYNGEMSLVAFPTRSAC